MSEILPSEPMQAKRRVLPALLGLLLFEVIGSAALYVELDRPLGFGVRFWGIVVLALAVCLMVWSAVRALVTRRGWFTLREFLVFVLLIGTALGWAGNRYQQTREQRIIGSFLSSRGARLFFGGTDEPGFEQLLGREYFHGIRYVDCNLRELAVEDLAVLARLHELEELQLCNGAITEEHIRYLEELTSLKRLVLDSLIIDDSGLKCLKGHPALRSISIYRSTIEPDILLHLRGLPKLKNL